MGCKLGHQDRLADRLAGSQWNGGGASALEIDSLPAALLGLIQSLQQGSQFAACRPDTKCLQCHCCSLCLVGGSLGSMVGSWQGRRAAAGQLVGASASPAPAPPPATPSEASALVSLSPVATSCGLGPEAAATRLALAPPSVQAFIQRWGQREGIDEAYSAACTMTWDTAVLESTDEVPGHHHESATEAAFREQVKGTAAASEGD
jgi:hypothetical protein